MRKAIFAAAAGVAAFFAAPASAATCTVSAPGDPGSCYFNYNTNVDGTFGNTDPNTYPPLFENLFKFDTGFERNATITITSSHLGLPLSYNVNFVSNGVRINGTVIPATSTGVNEMRQIINFRIPAGAQEILVRGSSGMNGVYQGLLTLSGVPEPSTWAMMILGIGFAGGAMRLRRRQGTRPAFA